MISEKSLNMYVLDCHYSIMEFGGYLNVHKLTSAALKTYFWHRVSTSRDVGNATEQIQCSCIAKAKLTKYDS